MSDQDNLLIERYDEIKNSLNLGYLDTIKIQRVFKKLYVLQNQ
jgi:hypothetical protein